MFSASKDTTRGVPRSGERGVIALANPDPLAHERYASWGSFLFFDVVLFSRARPHFFAASHHANAVGQRAVLLGLVSPVEQG